MSDIEPGKLSQFRPATRNANKHTGRGLKLLADAMNEVGYVAPITVAADGEALDGSARLETAFKKFGDEAIVIRHDGTKPIVMIREDIPSADTPAAKKIAYGANRIAQLDLEWEPLTLAADLEAGLDLGELFRPEEISQILEAAGTELLGKGKDPGPQEDKAKELQAKWQTATGQVWQLGRHRLVCGDCTDRATVEAVMKGEKAEALVTDPPYGMRLDTDFTKMPETRIASKSYHKVKGDDRDFDAAPFIEQFKDIAEQFWWGADYYYQSLPPRGSWLIWDKRNENSDGLIGNHFEVCWSRTPHRRKMIRHHWSGVNARNPGFERMHPTEKPIAVIADIIGEHTKSSATILDLFLGSGTTLLACEQLGRACMAIEIDPGYVAVSIQRWVDLTGKEPVLIH